MPPSTTIKKLRLDIRGAYQKGCLLQTIDTVQIMLGLIIWRKPIALVYTVRFGMSSACLKPAPQPVNLSCYLELNSIGTHASSWWHSGDDNKLHGRYRQYPTCPKRMKTISVLSYASASVLTFLSLSPMPWELANMGACMYMEACLNAQKLALITPPKWQSAPSPPPCPVMWPMMSPTRAPRNREGANRPPTSPPPTHTLVAATCMHKRFMCD